MIPLLQRAVFALLWDEDMGPRWVILALGSIGALVANGGAVPTTGFFVPGLGIPPPWVGGLCLGAAGILTTIMSTLPKPPEAPARNAG